MRFLVTLGAALTFAASTYGSISIDANTSKDQGTANQTVTTTAFSTSSGNELLLAFIATDYRSGANTTVSSVSGGGLTWVLAVRTNIQAGTSEIWRAFASAPLSNVSVTATLSQSVSSSLTVLSFTGLDTSGANGSGAIGRTASNSASSGPPSASLVTSRNNSWVFGVGNDYDNAIARTPAAGQTLVHQNLATVGDTYWVQMLNSPVAASGTAVTVSDGAPTGDRFNLSIIEILPAVAAGAWSLSGSITPLPAGGGASVALGGASSATAASDASGNYSFTGLSNGVYTVTPTKSGFTFSPASQTSTISGASASGVNFGAQPAPTGIQLIQKNVNGSESTGNAMSVSFPSANTAGNFLIVTGTSARPASAITLTDTAGNTYIKALGPINDAAQDVNLYVWYVPNCKSGPNRVTITPSAPSALEIHVSEFSGVARTAPLDQVSFATGSGALASSGIKTPTVNGELIFGYSWVVNNASAGPGFTPLSLVNGDLDEYQVQTTSGPVAATFTQSAAPWLAVMATFKPAGSLTISGTITPSEWGAGATVTLSGSTSAAVIADANGDFSFSGLADGAYTIAPSKTGFAFTPANQNVILNGTSVSGESFSAQSVSTYSIRGTISPAARGAQAQVALTGAATATVTADSSGNYVFPGLANGAYVVTPNKSGYTFSPANGTVTLSGADQSAVDFSASALAPVLSVNTAAVSFLANQGGASPAPYPVVIANAGTGSLNFTASSDSAWLSVSPASGVAPQQIQLIASQAGLAVGSYTGHVTIGASGVQGSPFTITVSLSVGVIGDWLMVDHDAARTGYALDETAITTANVNNLQLSWATTVDAAVTAQPLLVRSVQIAGQTRDALVVGTGKNTLYALDAGNGSVLWSRNFGPPTPNTWGLPDGFGIEGSPVIDRTTGRIYTVSTDGIFHTLSLADGTDVYPALTLVANAATNKVWGGLNKIGNNVYVATGSNGGDVAPWRGQVYQVDVSAAPKLAGNFVVTPGIPAPNGGGGIWGYGGVSADPATGNMFAASAFDSNQTTLPYSDSIIALTGNLNVLGSYNPPQASSYSCAQAPCDLDFASTPVFFQPPNCPAMVAAGNKDGNLYVFRVSDLTASGSPFQVLQLNVPSDSIGSGGVAGVPAYSAADNMLFVTTAGAGFGGVAAGVVGLNITSSCNLQVGWSIPLGGSDMPNSTPTVANGIVFVGEGKTGIVHAYNATTGAQLWQSSAQFGAASTYTAPIVAGGKIYTGSWKTVTGGGIVGAFALPAPTPILSVSPQSLTFNAASGGANPAPLTINVANSGAGTLNFTAASDSPWLSVSPQSGTAPLALQISANITGLAVGSYTGHITVTAPGAQGSPGTITVTLSVSSGGSGAIAIDARAFGDGTSAVATVETSAFSTAAANELLLAFISTDWTSGANTRVNSVSGGALTWVLVQRANIQKGTSEIWRAFTTSPLSNVTVTAVLSQKVFSSITVMTFTGADPSGTNGSGAIGAKNAAAGPTGAPAASLVTTRNNSLVLGVGNDFDNPIARTVGLGQTLVHQYMPSVGDTYWVQMQNKASALAGTTVTVNDAAPTTDRWNLAICEVLPKP